MASGNEFYSRINHPKEISELLEILCEPGGASLALDSDLDIQLPVVVETASIGTDLRINLTAIRSKFQVQSLLDGEAYRLIGNGPRGQVRTPPLIPEKVWDEDGRLLCQSAFPAYLEKLQRRDTFRAELREIMKVRVDLHAGPAHLTGWLRDISITGCLVDLAASAAWQLEQQPGPVNLEMTFPDGSHFMAPATACHRSVKDGRVLCGFRLDLTRKDQQQQMWYMVHETERETARSAQSAHESLRPSPLYRGSAHENTASARHNSYQGSMARRLAHSANWLITVILELRQGEQIDGIQLSQQSEYLLSLLDRDREGLLHALVCLHKEPPLVQHCLSVATRLVDITADLALTPVMRKALAASALIHDLGKELLPPILRKAKHLDGDQYRQHQQHVALLRQRLQNCQWVSATALEAVIEGANERLDGSGYPAGRKSDELNQLMRLAAVVDVADAMGRDRPDRPGAPIEDIHRHLMRYPEQFDPRWVKNYIKRFGPWPIGTLVRWSNDELAWILSLDKNGQPASVRHVIETGSPDSSEGTLLTGKDLHALGKPVQALPMSEYL